MAASSLRMTIVFIVGFDDPLPYRNMRMQATRRPQDEATARAIPGWPQPADESGSN